MTSKPWLIWTAFFACLTVFAVGMLWLSIKMVRLERLRESDRIQTETARQEAELQERVSASLYRMDLKLIPLVAEEASRPYQYYRTAGDASVNDNPFGTALSTGSQLLSNNSEFVLLYFEVDSYGNVNSPQVAFESAETKRQQTNVAGSDKAQFQRHLQQVKSFANFEVLRRYVDPIVGPSLEFPEAGNRVAIAGNPYEVPAIDRVVDNINDSKSDSPKAATFKGKSNKLLTQQARGKDRLNQDFNRRRDSTRNIAQQQAMTNFVGQRAEPVAPQSPGVADLVYGVMQPIWLGENLLLVRPLKESGETKFQCCWLDWKEIQAALKDEISELLLVGQIDLKPVREDGQLDIGMALTTLPVQLAVDRDMLRASLSINSDASLDGSSEVWKVLTFSWLGFAVSAVVAALLLAGVIGLSERRANFVSAVTHELRTPLTTFKMYSDMLASDMVPAEKKQQYVGTLRKQADRLSHLVDNVLQFAKLENNPTRSANEDVQVGPMLNRFVDRLVNRADEAGLQFELTGVEQVNDVRLRTQPAMIEQVLFNLVDNACKYGRPSSTGVVNLNVRREGGHIKFAVSDGGPGVDLQIRNKMFKPFHKSDLEAANSEPGVGLGLALCRRMASSLDGELKYETNNDGARFVLTVPI
jgi:signal transduction histidine kinase